MSIPITFIDVAVVCLSPNCQKYYTSGCQFRIYWIVWLLKSYERLCQRSRKWDSTCWTNVFQSFPGFDSTLLSLTHLLWHFTTVRIWLYEDKQQGVQNTDTNPNEKFKTRVRIDYFQHYLKDGSNFSLRHREHMYSPLTFHPIPVLSSPTYSRERAGVHRPDPKISFGDKETA